MPGCLASRPTTFAALLATTVHVHANQPAMAFEAGGQRRVVSWGELGAMITHASGWLARQAGPHTLSIVAEPSAGYQLLELAALVSGWSVNPIYEDTSPAELRRILEIVEPGVVAVGHRGPHLFPELGGTRAEGHSGLGAVQRVGVGGPGRPCPPTAVGGWRWLPTESVPLLAELGNDGTGQGYRPAGRRHVGEHVGRAESD